VVVVGFEKDGGRVQWRISGLLRCIGQFHFVHALEGRISRSLLPSQVSGFTPALALISDVEQHPSIRRDKSTTCETELDKVNACVPLLGTCVNCINAVYESIALTTNPICIDFMNGICPAIESSCNCGNCISELENYYSCRVQAETTCDIEVDCSDPCREELGIVAGCLPSNK